MRVRSPISGNAAANLDPAVVVLPSSTGEMASVLTPEALAFVAGLERRFRGERALLLRRRSERQARLDAGERPTFPVETRSIREAEWTVAPPRPDLERRVVEITGPVDRKMIINALNSGADVFMADFEDSLAPTWENVVLGQGHLRDAVRGTIDWTHPATGRRYHLDERTATLMVRPRGWHLPEKHVLVDGAPISASLFDFGLHFFHNARALVGAGSGPYFYLPKLEGRLEARLWNEVFLHAQEALGLPRGTIRATVLIETILAAFEMDEILWELREHSAGLNCGRWDYIFSFIRKFRADRRCVLPDRASVTMGRPFLSAYSRLLVRTCHRRGAHALGGMAAQIPIKDDPERNAIAIEKVRADKRREALAGHDGTWVAHPGLVGTARAEFEAVAPGPNQLLRPPDPRPIEPEELLEVPPGTITEEGLRGNLSVAVRYLEAWLRGQGCVPLDHLMEDAATAEIARTQVWQWIRHRAVLSDGRPVDAALVRRLLDAEMARLRAVTIEPRWTDSSFEEARLLVEDLIFAPELTDFLTLPAYELLVAASLPIQEPRHP